MNTRRAVSVVAILAIALLVAFAALAVSAPAPAAADEPGFQIMPKNQQYYGKTYAEWVRTWHQWILEIPAGVNPMFDDSGANCGQSQNYPVWFLTGAFGGSVERDCDVPADKPVFFPVQNAMWFPFPSDPPMSKQEKLELERSFRNQVNGAAATTVIDDHEVDGLRRYHFDSGWFDTWMPDDNLIDFLVGDPEVCDWPAGNSGPHYNDGLYLLVFLDEGQHEIRFTGWDGGLDVTYNLDVQ